MITEVEFPGRAAHGPIDITDILNASLKLKRPVRDDANFAHFSDMGRCDKQIHARRSGMYSSDPPLSKMFMFQIGHFAEAEMLAALLHAYGNDWTILHGGLIVAHIDDDDIHFSAHPNDEILSTLDPSRNVIGHPDFFLRHRQKGGLGFTIDAKTMMFPMTAGVRNAPNFAKPEYFLQTAGYAVAHEAIHENVPQFGIWQACKQGGGDELVPYNTAEFRPMILRRLRELSVVTDPRAPEPEPTPPNYSIHVVTRGPRKGEIESWLCDYCDNTTCPRNENLGALLE
ncbi:MAG: hypothetical protein NVSMB64_22650 [Candidatus Velthaea sp.]